MIGQTISHYRIVEKLGSGGMGVVYAAQDVRLGRRVALKFLPESPARDLSTLQRFEREARAASSLNHPGICTIYEVEEYDHKPVIVMELLEGESLKERISKGPFANDELVDFSIQTCDALQSAHAKGIIHRDIKPANLFIVGGIRVKILDFGLAKMMAGRPAENEVDEESLTAEGVIPGTTAYMSPEQVRGEEIDARSDLFSLGVVLYEMATGKRPFAAKNRVLLMNAILNAEPAEPSSINRALPRAWDVITLKALEKEQSRRYQQASEIAADLKLLRTGNSAVAPQSPGDGKTHVPYLVALRQGRADAAVIFIHGFSGHPRVTWGAFPDALASHLAPSDWDLFSLGYASKLSLDLAGIWTADPDLNLLATYLHTALDQPPLDRYKRLTLIAHSMGGLVVQRALLDHDDVLTRARHVFLFGTPSAGLTKATWLARFKRQWRDLRPESPFIRSLRAEWDQKFGAKPPFELVSIAGDRDEFVPAASCFAPFPANCCAVVPGNHLEIVKPASTAELSVQIVLKRLSAGSTLPVCPPADAANVTSRLMLMPAAFEQRRGRRFGLRIFAAIVAAVAIIAAGALYFGGNHINSLAVLPFTNATGDANMEYLSDGITEGIIDRLSELPSLKVISRTSAFHYKQREIAPQKVAKELGVQALVTGRVVQHGTDLSVSAELVDAREDKQLWGEQYSWTMANMTSVQREIAIAISRNLRVHLTSGEKKELAKSYTTNTEAYQLYLKGRYYWGKNTVEGLHKGIEYFQQAIGKDPGNAQAYAGLAGCYDDLAGGMAYLPPQENFPKAKAAAMKALELDDTLAEAHTALGWIKWGYDWDWSSAEREYKRAIELDASSAVAHGRYGTYLVTMGRFDEGIAEGRRAQELDPLSQRIVGFLGYQYLVAGRYDESISQLKKAIELDPAATWLHAMLGWAYARKGMYAQAIAEHERMGPQAYAVSGENQTVAAGLAWIYALAGRQKDATRILEAFNHLPSQTYVDFYQVGVIYAGLGDKERAFESLQKGYAQRSGGMAYLKVEPFWDNVRSDPRFADLLRRMAFPQ